MLERGDIIVQKSADDDMWYVQEVALLDIGRFKDKEVAEKHRQFLIDHDYRE